MKHIFYIPKNLIIWEKKWQKFNNSHWKDNQNTQLYNSKLVTKTKLEYNNEQLKEMLVYINISWKDNYTLIKQ